MSQLPLNAVRVFVGAARCLSFKGAAAGLCVTPGAVSRQIRTLEEYLGVALFERGYRSIALTPAGELFLAQAGPGLDSLELAARCFREPDIASPKVAKVCLDATPTFAMHWLIPRLAGFRWQHPEIEVRLTTSQGVIVDTPDIDLHIRRDPRHFGALSGEAFMDEYAVPVCRPMAGGLPGLPLIRMRSRPDLWPKWLAERSLPAAQAAYLEFDNTILAIQAACEGLGIALVPVLFVGELLRNGALGVLPGASPLRSGSYHLLRRQRLSAAGEIFAAWLAQAASREPVVTVQPAVSAATA